ncbi:MAG: 30S ribosomal protein S9 [Sedimentisphaerales bacterium]|nr:30S ribosomal protein S9 [Sedimentisphaerales bacterium]
MKPGQYCWGTGRRKCSIARVRVRPGEGNIVINGKAMEAYFPTVATQNAVKAPLEVTDCAGRFDVFVNVTGGGPTGQSGAVLLGLARALAAADPDTFASLRDAGYLTRDSRMVERKKYGQKGARKRFQFSKR